MPGQHEPFGGLQFGDVEDQWSHVAAPGWGWRGPGADGEQVDAADGGFVDGEAMASWRLGRVVDADDDRRPARSSWPRPRSPGRASTAPHLLGIATAIWLHRVRPWLLPGPRHVHQLVGWPLIGAGSYLVVRSLQATRRVNLAHPDRLVTTGPYAVSRNPMYIGWALLHLGAGLAGGSGWILAAFPAAAGLVHRQILREERDLADEFGDEFERYRTAAPRYLRAAVLSSVGQTASQPQRAIESTPAHARRS